MLKQRVPLAQPLRLRSLEATLRQETMMQLTSSFSLSNTCVVFVNKNKRHYVPKFISRDGVTALIHSFNEFTFGYNRFTGVWPALPEDSNLLSQCEEREHAIGIFFSNNLGHQLFHAVSAWSALQGIYQAAAARGNVSFLPLLGRKSGSTISHGWEFTLRAFVADSAQKILSDASRLVHTCSCFRRIDVDVSGMPPGAVGPVARKMNSDWRLATMRNVAVLRGLSSPSPPIQRRLLFLQRRGATRVIVGESSLLAALDRSAPNTATPVVMEGLPLAEQMWLVGSSSGMIGLHGQGLAMLVFLPWERHRCALIEIQPEPRRSIDFHWTRIYSDYVRPRGIFHELIVSHTVFCSDKPVPLSRGSARPNPLKCNVTVETQSLLNAVARSMTDRKSVV